MLSIVIGLFGMVGAVARYWVSTIPIWDHTSFPYGTLLCNLLGCFILGWFNQTLKVSNKVHPYIKTGVGTGLIGSFTTFSTFSVESIQLFTNGKVFLGLIYVIVSFIGGWLFVWFGDRLGHIQAGNGVGEN